MSSLAPPSGIQPGSSGPVRRALARPAKRSARRIIALALMLALAFTLPPLPLPARASAASLFPDLERHWSRAYVETLARQGILAGTAPGEPFRPAEPATRGEFLAWLVRALDQAGAEGSPKGEAGSPPGAHQPPPFHDVLSGHPFFAELTRAREMGLARGTEAGFFYPAAPLTRQEAALLLWRAYRAASPDRDDSSAAAASSTPTPPPATALSASLAAASPHPAGGSIPAVLSTGGPPARSSSPQAASPGAQPLLPSSTPADLYTFADAATVAPWAREELARAVEAGLVQGEETVQPQRGRGLIRLKLLSPGKSLTRAEAATLVFRLLTKVTVELASRPSFLAQRSEKSPVPKAAAKSPPAGRNAGLAPVSLPASRNEVQSVNLKEQAASSRQNGSTGRNGDPAPSGGTGENGGAGQNGHPGQNDGAGKDSNAGPNGDPAQNSGPGQKGGSSDSRGSGSTQKGEDCAAQASPGGCAPGSGHDPGKPPFFSPPADGELGVRWVEFLPPWDDAEPTATDMSFLLDPPAGKHGRVVVCGEHLCFEDGTRARFWGVNLTHGDFAPPKDQAARIASYLARLGFNAVRFPHMSSDPYLGRLIDPSLKGYEKALELLDRFDYFVAQLKARGIYVHLSTNHRPAFARLPSIPDADKLLQGEADGWHSTRTATVIEESLQEAHRRFLRLLLTHHNPYTGLTYAEEPAVAFLEIANENSLVDRWNFASPDNPIDKLPSFYQEKLDSLWRSWTGDQNAPRPRGGRNQGFSEQEKARYFRFLADLDRKYYSDMISFVKNELGYRGVVIGTQGFSWFALKNQAEISDVVDTHNYWDPPRFSGKPKRNSEWKNHGKSSLEDLTRSAVAALSLRRVWGKPFIVTEYNHSYPNPYGVEGMPLLAATAAQQDWDGAFVFHLAVSVEGANHGTIPFNDVGQHSGKLATLPLAAALFLGDRKTSGAINPIYVPLELLPIVITRVHAGNTIKAAESIGLDLSSFLLRPVAITFDSVTDSKPVPDSNLKWTVNNHLLKVSGKSAAFVAGVIAGQEIAVGDLRITVPQGSAFGVLGAVSLTTEELNASRRFLVITAGAEPESEVEAACTKKRDPWSPCAPARPLLLEIRLPSKSIEVKPLSPWLILENTGIP